MPAAHPRVQVTVDPELREALDRAAPYSQARSRAGLVRELALRGAEAAADESRSRREALRRLFDYDFSELRNIDEERRERLPKWTPTGRESHSS